MTTSESVVEVSDLRKVYRGGFEAVTRHRFLDRARRDLRAARPERRRQEHHDRDPRGLPRPHRRRRARARHRPAARRPGLEGAARHRAAVQRRAGQRDGARAAHPLRRALPEPARGRRGHRRRRPRGEGVDAASEALGRPAPPRRRRARHHRHPRAALPRRADDRLRSRGAAAVLGPHPGPQGARARPSCSPPTTSTRPRSSATGRASSPAAGSSRSARSTSSAAPRRGSRSCAGSRTARCASSAPSSPANSSPH